MFSKGHQQPPAGYKEELQTQVKGQDVMTVALWIGRREWRAHCEEFLPFKKNAGRSSGWNQNHYLEGGDAIPVQLEVGNSQLEDWNSILDIIYNNNLVMVAIYIPHNCFKG